MSHLAVAGSSSRGKRRTSGPIRWPVSTPGRSLGRPFVNPNSRHSSAPPAEDSAACTIPMRHRTEPVAFRLWRCRRQAAKNPGAGAGQRAPRVQVVPGVLQDLVGLLRHL
jgi:hypothetical protein